MAGPLVFVAPNWICTSPKSNGQQALVAGAAPTWDGIVDAALSYAAVRLPYSHVVLSEFGSKAESAAR
jgi:hypothetical protein